MASDATAGHRAPRDAEYFDAWYADMEKSPAKDEIVARHLGLPPELGPAGVLSWDAVGEVAAELALSAGALLVDLACGRGGYGIEIARRTGCALVGVDFSAVALEQARATASRRLPSGRAEFRVGTLTETGLPTAAADALLCSDSVQFADPPVAALREMRRVLRPGGRVVLTGWHAQPADDPRVGLRIRNLDLGADLRSAGFVDIRVDERPAWLDAERRMWQDVDATPDDGHDPALSSLREEGRRSLDTMDALRRVLAVATAPDPDTGPRATAT